MRIVAFDFPTDDFDGFGSFNQQPMRDSSPFGSIPDDDAPDLGSFSDLPDFQPISNQNELKTQSPTYSDMVLPGNNENSVFQTARPKKARNPFPIDAIPWGKVLPILAVVLGIVLIIVFRDEITAFIRQLLSWTIAILVIYLIIRFLFFRRRR